MGDVANLNYDNADMRKNMIGWPGLLGEDHKWMEKDGHSFWGAHLIFGRLADGLMNADQLFLLAEAETPEQLNEKPFMPVMDGRFSIPWT